MTSFFGWKVVAAAFTVALFGWGISFYGPPVFLQALHSRTGWPVSVISSAITFHFIASAVFVGWLGGSFLRRGAVAMVRLGAVALAVGAIGWSLAQEPWHLFVAALSTGLGMALTTGVAVNAIVTPWFDRRRATALSLAFNGASVGGVVFTPLWAVLIDALGFVGAAAAIAVITVLVLWPMAGTILGETPQSRGQHPDGVARPPAGESASRAAPRNRRALLADGRFITLTGAYTLALFAQVGLIAHFVAALAPALGGTGAAVALSFATICAVAGRFAWTPFLERRDRRVAGALNLGLQAIGIAMLALALDGSWPLLLAGCVLFGLGIGNLVSLPPLIAQSDFAPSDVPQVVALSTAIFEIVFAFGPGTLGAVRDWSGGYPAAFAIVVALYLAAALILLAGKLRRS